MAHDSTDLTPPPAPPTAGGPAAGAASGDGLATVGGARPPTTTSDEPTPGVVDTVTLLRQAFAAAPRDEMARAVYAQALLRDGVAAAKARDKERARLRLRELSRLTPGDERVWLWRATVAQGYTEALECLSQVLAISPEHPQALAAMAKLRERAAARVVAGAVPAPPPTPVAAASTVALPAVAEAATPSAAPSSAPPPTTPSPTAAPVPAPMTGVVAAAPPVQPPPVAPPAPPRPLTGLTPAASSRPLDDLAGGPPARAITTRDADGASGHLSISPTRPPTTPGLRIEARRLEPAGQAPAADTSQPGSVLRLFDAPVPTSAPVPAFAPRPRQAPPAPIGFRPPSPDPPVAPAQRLRSEPPTAERPVLAALPHTPPPAPAPPVQSSDAPPARGLVLVVDDSPTVLKVVEFELRKHRLDIVTATDGPDALARLRTLTPDLVLLDINMPLMDGYQVCREIRGDPRTARVPVVMLSGKDGFFDKIRGRLAGAAGYITKPFDAPSLMAMLEKHFPVRP